MKNIVIFLLFAVFFMSCTAEEYEPWGAWNFGNKATIGRVAIISGKVYFRNDSQHLTFRPADKNNSAQINYEGGYYEINKVMYNEHNKKIVSFYAERYIGSASTGKLYKIKINMHFIDNDHIWLEVDYTDKKYPTTPDFTTWDFPGEKVIFWRGEYIGEYDDPKAQEYIERIRNISP
jgi:hypothetical protein